MEGIIIKIKCLEGSALLSKRVSEAIEMKQMKLKNKSEDFLVCC